MKGEVASQMSGGMSSVKLTGNLCMGTGREADTKLADYRLPGCVGVLFVSVTKRPKRRRRSAFFCAFFHYLHRTESSRFNTTA